MLHFNCNHLVSFSVQGEIHHPQKGIYKIDNEGKAVVIPTSGGITYNVQVGDLAFGWVGDHVEPGVSIKNPDEDSNLALTTYSCIGNKAMVISGNGKGCIGYVTGTHGGIEHVLIHFNEKDLTNFAIGDTILIQSCGQGLEIKEFPDVKIMNIDPVLFKNLGITEENGRLIVPITAEIPAFLMGSGMGFLSASNGDYDIMTNDVDTIKSLGLDNLRLGDIVLLKDQDNTYGRAYKKNAVTIGVVVHCDCIRMGHGPGITTIMTSKLPLLVGKYNSNANISNYMEDIMKI